MKRMLMGMVLGLISVMEMIMTAGCGEKVVKVSVLGDSYSTFEGKVVPDSNLVWYTTHPDLQKTDVNSVEQTWWGRLLDENGWELERNNSFSGATICYTGYYGEDYTNRSFVNRANALGDPDLIFVFGGTNDSWAHSPVGEFRFGDISEEELWKVRPAIEELIVRLERNYPKARKCFIVNDILSDEITQALESLCVLHNLPVVMLHDIDKQNGHPSVKGMAQIAEQIGEVLN